jgi:hypothetical protein
MEILHRHVVRGACGCVIVILTGCASGIADKQPEQMSNIELLKTYGSLVRDKSSTKDKIDAEESEVEKRQLLTVPELYKIKNSVVYVGMRSSIVLATLGEPSFVMKRPDVPNVQIWSYLSLLPTVFTLKVEVDANERPTTGIFGANENISNIFFVKDGIVIGLRVHTDGVVDPATKVWRPGLTAAGTIFSVPSPLPPNWTTQACAIGCGLDAR